MHGKCFRITDAKAIRGNTNAEVFGVKCNYDEWKTHQFCPTKGVIGQIVCDGYVKEGQIYIIECMYHCAVPVLTWGLEEISPAYFKENFREVNAALAYDPTGERCSEASIQEIMDTMMGNLGF